MQDVCASGICWDPIPKSLWQSHECTVKYAVDQNTRWSYKSIIDTGEEAFFPIRGTYYFSRARVDNDWVEEKYGLPFSVYQTVKEQYAHYGIDIENCDDQ